MNRTANLAYLLRTLTLELRKRSGHEQAGQPVQRPRTPDGTPIYKASEIEVRNGQVIVPHN